MQQAVAQAKKRAAEHVRQMRQARELAAQGRGEDTEVAHVARGEYVIPEALQTPEVMAVLRRAAAARGVALGRLNVGHAMNSVNPTTGAPEFGFSDSLYPNSPGIRSNPGESQIALEWWQKPAVTNEMKNGIKSTLRGLTNGTLPDAQINGIYNQLLDNIPLNDALKLAPLDPGQNPIVLTPDQQSIIQSQIGKLKPDDRQAVQDQYDGLVKGGGITCPMCGK